MKNIHILPTDKPSRLVRSKINGDIFLDPHKNFVTAFEAKFWEYLNLYITSPNEDIYENDYVITKDGRLVQISYLLSKDLQGAFKVIITTDDLLIKDGIEKIDDNFLKWFFKNQDCEYVSEEACNMIKPEQKTLNGAIGRNGISDPGLNEIRLDMPKQETLEEAFLKTYFGSKISFNSDIGKSFELGAKWQEQNSYSEEEVIELLQKALTHKDDGEIGSLVTAQGEIRPANFFSWFERFKNK